MLVRQRGFQTLQSHNERRGQRFQEKRVCPDRKLAARLGTFERPGRSRRTRLHGLAVALCRLVGLLFNSLGELQKPLRDGAPEGIEFHGSPR
jgi:hypothetical protein